MSRETASWAPNFGSPDRIINSVKPMADARGLDTVRNTGFATGAVALHKDSIVGAQYRLNAKPKWQVLKTINKAFDSVWADEFQQFVEPMFNTLSDSNACWLDASGTNTFTGQLRLIVGGFAITGEVVAQAQWDRDPSRPCMTSILPISRDRLCNPQGIPDTRYLRRGIVRDYRGKALSYWFRQGNQYDLYPDDLAWTWVNIPRRKPWGRTQVIHIIEQQDVDQSRGVADMVSALKQMRMTKKFQDITLQSAVVNATYAAAIESELPSDLIAVAMGNGAAGGQTPTAALNGVYGSYLGMLTRYLGGANNIKIDGAMVPHLFPGTKLNLRSAATPGGVGTGFEESLMRHTAAALGLSYEEFSRDFSKTNYSSGRAAMAVSGRFMAARKKHVADRYATEVYALVLEEWMGDGVVPLPRGVTRDAFYAPLAKEAFTTATWIGSGAGQIDELKETEAALMRVAGGLSTYEREAARLGLDVWELFEQRAREEARIKELGLVFTSPGTTIKTLPTVDDGKTRDATTDPTAPQGDT